MGNTYGQQTVGTFGTSIRVSADGQPEMKAGGVTIDWTAVAAAGSDSTLEDGVSILTGDKYLRYGQVICLITGGEISTLTITGSPTGGTFTVTVGGQTTAGIAYNANAATIQAAIEALSTVGAGKVVVTGSGPFTLTFSTALGDLTVSSSGASLTGGSSPAATVTTASQGARNDLYGPYDPAAVDGRQTLAIGKAFIIDRTVKESELKSNHPPALEGGRVWAARIIQSGVATHTLAAGPTYAELIATFPRLRLTY
jgi:hypothetical protein